MRLLSVGLMMWAGLAQGQTLLTGGDLGGWTVQSFVGETRYEVVNDPLQGSVLQGTAEGSASALGFERVIDTSATPWLDWRWQVVTAPTLAAPEQSKAGDDYAARVYVVRKGSFGLFSTRSLVYVHSSDHQPGEIWDSPYTGKVKMMAVTSGNDGEWVSVRRNLAEDWAAAFGSPVDELDGVALMVDADNSGSTAVARFGDIRLAAQ